MRRRRLGSLLVAVCCGTASCSGSCAGDAAEFDPLFVARASIGKIVNREAVVPAMCYTRTDGLSNPCYVCHTDSRLPNAMHDFELQEQYSFSDVARENRWTNLFADRAPSKTTDAEILEWVRADNYAPLQEAMRGVPADYGAWRPDVDLGAGFDADGFAKDGSGWRAYRYKPFPGTFWPASGNVGDAAIRLPEAFRRDAGGERSRAIYKANLAILELAIARLGVELPETYTGAAASVAVERFLYPAGTEFLHTVRYLDPDAPDFRARRMKEVRYLKKMRWLDRWAMQRAYEKELDEKDEGVLPVFTGTPLTGVNNAFGWRLTGFIEDADGRLRLQTDEEHRFCMGCHSNLGVTVDSTFSFARKVPGEWRFQSFEGMPDSPSAGANSPEYLIYFQRVRGGDEFRSNREILERFFPKGELLEASVRRAAVGGDRDIRFLILPSRNRALQLDKVYRELVAEQRFDLGRDTFLTPPRVFRRIREESTGLKAFRDGQLWLDWPE